MTNAGLYASLMQEYGTKEEAGASVLISLESGPLMTMIILGSAGQATFEPEHLAGVSIPSGGFCWVILIPNFGNCFPGPPKV